MKDISVAVSTTPFASGKTKTVFDVPFGALPLCLLVTNDDITAGDGVRRVNIPGKGEIATLTTCDVFEFLHHRGVPTHFVQRYDHTSFLARKCRQIPLECVVRRIAFGSYLKRNPGTDSGMRLNDLVSEFFLKDDERHDPLVKFYKSFFDGPIIKMEIYEPKLPVQASSLLATISFGEMPEKFWWREHFCQMQTLARQVFELLEQAFGSHGITLVDMKIEFGVDSCGHLFVADVIDNDSWRIWPNGDSGQMLDKQVFRDIQDPTPAHLAQILENYRYVQAITRKFLLS